MAHHRADITKLEVSYHVQVSRVRTCLYWLLLSHGLMRVVTLNRL